jgi:hypothetical protein
VICSEDKKSLVPGSPFESKQGDGKGESKAGESKGAPKKVKPDLRATQLDQDLDPDEYQALSVVVDESSKEDVRGLCMFNYACGGKKVID